MGSEQSLRTSIVVSSGAGTANLTSTWDLVRWLRIKPVNETDTYDVTITDGDGIIMLKRSGVTGTFAEQIEMSLGIMKSIAIANASVDGTYQVRLDMH